MTMKARHVTACWTCYVSRKSIVVVESEYRKCTWKFIWAELLKCYDKLKPERPKYVTEMKSKIIPEVKKYIMEESRNLGEATRITAQRYTLKNPSKWSAYYRPQSGVNTEIGMLQDDEFNTICYDLSLHVDQGINFLRTEASEILAFMAMDCDRRICSDMPPHLPIAYGMKGSSLPMTVMRNIINDIWNDLKNQNTGVLCEVYDGQFHPIIVRSEKGEPLTCLQHSIDVFKLAMKEKDRSELLDELLMYSEIAEDDVDQIWQMNFEQGVARELDSVKISMDRRCEEDDIFRQISISSLPFNSFTMKDIRTEHRNNIWSRYLRNQKDNGKSRYTEGLTANELQEMIQGT